MMNTKFKFIICLLVFALSGCNKPVSYQTLIPTSGDPMLLEVKSPAIKQLVIENKTNALMLLGIDGCSACASAKVELNTCAINRSITIYYVNVTELTAEEHNALVDATSYKGDKAYAYPYSAAYPQLFLFDSCYVVSVFTSNFTANINTYTR